MTGRAPEPVPKGQGLCTEADLNRLGRWRLMLRRQSRAFYRSIRHPRNRRKGRIRAWLAEKVRNRHLWRPARGPVAAGLAGGLFFAMLPIPLQSLLAAGIGMARGWNLPATIGATWLSNPFTYVPMLIGAKYSVTGFFGLFGRECAAGQLTTEGMKQIWDTAASMRLGEAWYMAGPVLLQIAFGMVILGAVLAAAGWLLVHACWWLGAKSSVKPSPATPPRV